MPSPYIGAELSEAHGISLVAEPAGKWGPEEDGSFHSGPWEPGLGTGACTSAHIFFLFYFVHIFLSRASIQGSGGGWGHRVCSGLDHWECCLCACMCVCVHMCTGTCLTSQNLQYCVEVKVKGIRSGARFKY